MTFKAGTKLGTYEIIGDLIGAGGMGQVYRAHDPRLDRIVAIKVLAEELSHRPEFRERFEREARTISNLSHPHICTVYDISKELQSEMDPRHWTRADIVIEITSPSTYYYDGRTKSDTYRVMGVRELWLVDTEKKEIEVRSFDFGRTAVYKVTDILRSEVLSKIEIPVAAVFGTTPKL